MKSKKKKRRKENVHRTLICVVHTIELQEKKKKITHTHTYIIYSGVACILVVS